MNSLKKGCLLSLPILMLIGCGSSQLSLKMGLASTSSQLDPNKEVKKENRTEEMCTWYLFTIPIGDEATPAKAFNKLNSGAEYLNDVALYPKGFDYKFVAKSCWAADGVALVAVGGGK
jgi:hypothetical protein